MRSAKRVFWSALLGVTLAAPAGVAHIGVDYVSSSFDHIHVKGKVLWPDGKPIAGAQIVPQSAGPITWVDSMQGGFTWGFTFPPPPPSQGNVSKPVVPPANPLLTAADGSYEFLIWFAPGNADTFAALTADQIQIKVVKPGFTFSRVP
ncbi:MAG TPA: hypothetical protein VGK08_00255 [Thermoanaerobaculia bacterium]|jgi:hypothetical protein